MIFPLSVSCGFIVKPQVSYCQYGMHTVPDQSVYCIKFIFHMEICRDFLKCNRHMSGYHFENYSGAEPLPAYVHRGQMNALAARDAIFSELHSTVLKPLGFRKKGHWSIL